MSITNLPPELIYDIFVWIPMARNVGRAVCRVWWQTLPRTGVVAELYWHELMTSHDDLMVSKLPNTIEYISRSAQINCRRIMWVYHIRKCTQVYELAARFDRVNMLRRYHADGVDLSTDVVSAAVSWSSCKSVKFLRSLGNPIYESLCAEAIEHGSLDIAKLCIGRQIINPLHWAAIVMNNRFDIIKWTLSKGHEIPAKAVYLAGSIGSIIVIESMDLQERTYMALEMAAAAGRIEVFEWALSKQIPLVTRYISIARTFYRHDLLNWLLQHCVKPPAARRLEI